MKICVLMKQVASEDSSLVINNDKSGVELNNLNLYSWSRFMSAGYKR